MSKFLYPIYKLNIESYKKWWLYHKKAGGSGILSEILQGFSFNLENTLNRKFKLFEIEGNSVQDGTPSPDNEVPIESAGDNENIIDIQPFNITGGTTSYNGKSFTYNLKAGTYTLQRKYTKSSNAPSSAGMVQLKRNNVYYKNLDAGVASTIVELTEDTELKLEFYLSTSITSTEESSIDFYDIKLEKGNKASGYSPYGMGSINEKIGNANILDTSEVKTVKNQTGDNRTGYYCKIPQTGRYLLLLNTTNTMYFGKSSDINVSTTLIGSTNSSFSTNYDFNAGEYFVIWGTKKDTDKLMVKLADGQTDYVPHEEQDYSIFVQQPMRSIGDVRDCFVKKSDGWYERHYILQELYDGSDDENWQTNVSDGIRFLILLNSIKANSIPLCNFFKGTTNLGYLFENGYLVNPASKNISFCNSSITTLAEWKNWLSTHNVVVQYEAETPLDLPCTQAQIDVLENLPSTYKDFTIIQSQDETPAYLKIQYYKEG